MPFPFHCLPIVGGESMAMGQRKIPFSRARRKYYIDIGTAAKPMPLDTYYYAQDKLVRVFQKLWKGQQQQTCSPFNIYTFQQIYSRFFRATNTRQHTSYFEYIGRYCPSYFYVRSPANLGWSHCGTKSVESPRNWLINAISSIECTHNALNARLPLTRYWFVALGCDECV